ncbi:hypothetical protein [Nonomuraea sp. NPDC050643]|uniref:hypothetical protein n=1 Tax=Nonomuraea sp. NPDC050643 TaxID=3155660 RepID=UPI0033F10907
MTTRALDHSGRDRPSRFERLVIAQMLGVVGEMADAGLDAGAAMTWSVRPAGRATAWPATQSSARPANLIMSTGK